MSDVVQRVAMKAVIINQQGRVLILREAKTYDEGTQSGRYHFPGGRIEAGENFEEALRREVKEETGLKVTLKFPIYVGEWYPVIRDVPHQIIATFIVCSSSRADIVLSSEHDDFQWVDPANWDTLDVMPPDDKVLDRVAEWQKGISL